VYCRNRRTGAVIAGAGINNDPAVGLAKMPPQVTAVALKKAFDYSAP
jgi:hypothetical protein